MRNLTPAFLVPFIALCAGGPPARAGCELAPLAELPVTISGLRALTTLQLNGRDASFIVDSGAFFSSITPQTAAEVGLQLETTSLVVQGVGGSTTPHVTTVKDLGVAGAHVPKVPFLVLDNDVGHAGLLGQNFLRIGDVEYDFANGALRLWREHDCNHANVAYWLKAGQPSSVIDIESYGAHQAHTRGRAFVNGTEIRVMFDTGATSVLSLHAAERLGVRPADAGVRNAGYASGVGTQLRQTWIAPFASFKIGDEEIRNTHLRIGDAGGLDADMLIGADFFLSHRIYVSNRQHRLYFSYNGGPVFNLATEPAPPSAAPDAADTGSGGAAAAVAPARDDTGSADPVDAAGYFRRAEIYLVRRDFGHAIADLTHATGLAPGEPRYLRERAEAYLGSQQPDLAAADLDQVIRLKPDDVPALMLRAQLHLSAHRQTEALADLDAAARSAPKEDAVHLELGRLYVSAGSFAPAIAEYDRWLTAHPRDVHKPEGLRLRCSARALTGQDLDKALADCNAALRDLPKGASASTLEVRGLVRLRRGEIDKALADYSAALVLAPRNAQALYGRGLARLRKGATADGQADLAAARDLRPRIAEQFKRIGLSP